MRNIKKKFIIKDFKALVIKKKLHKCNLNIEKIKERLKFIPINRMAEPKEIAVYIKNLATEDNSYMTGQTITVSGGE